MPETMRDVIIYGVAVEPGGWVMVDVYGSSPAICGTLVYHVPQRRDRAVLVRALRDFGREQTPLTMISDDQGAELLNEDSS